MAPAARQADRAALGELRTRGACELTPNALLRAVAYCAASLLPVEKKPRSVMHLLNLNVHIGVATPICMSAASTDPDRIGNAISAARAIRMPFCFFVLP